MKYGSVCSGIEAASVAWESLGWQAQWYSEIEHFPSAVLAHRFPTVPNLGDMTQIHNSEHFNGNSIDLLVGGTPCQSFSVAGLRKGLDDTRGQLMLTFCELAARKRPKWVVWENVPGVLSSNKGEDLASFLGLLTGREIHPPVGGWKNSGIIEGIGSAYGVAWTVLDAQHFGVAQRRRRIFAVGYLGDWRPAAAVLFESYRLSGDIKESRKKRKATASDVEGGVGGGGIPRVSGSLDTECGGGKLTHQSVNNGHLVPSWWNGEQTAATLTKQNANGAQRMPDKDNLGAVLQPLTHAFKVRGGSETETGEQGGTPGKKAGKGYLGPDELAFTIGTTQDQQIAQPIAIQGNLIGRTEGGPQGIGVSQEGNMYTLTKADVHGVAQPIAFQQNTRDEVRYINGDGSIAGALSASSGMKQTNYVAQPVPFRKAKRAQSKDDHETWEQDEKTNTLNAFDTGDIRTTQAVVQPIAVDLYNGTIQGQTTCTLTSEMGVAGHSGPKLLQPIAVDVYNQSISGNKVGIVREQHGTNMNAILQPIAVDTYNQTINEHSVQTIRSDGNHTDRTGAVLHPIAVDTYNQTINEHTTQTIRANNTTEHIGAVLTSQSPTIIDRAAFNQGENAQYDIKIEEGETMPSLVARGPHGVGQPKPPTMAILGGQHPNAAIGENTCPTITNASGAGGGHIPLVPQQPTMAIRRLTPKECERLQGFPDDWTLIPYRNKSEEQCPDGPRYKACGNSMAVPVMRWIGQRIQMVEGILKELHKE